MEAVQEEEHASEPEEEGEEDALVGTSGFLERQRLLGSIVAKPGLLLVDQRFPFKLILLHYNIMKKQTFLLPELVTIPALPANTVRPP